MKRVLGLDKSGRESFKGDAGKDGSHTPVLTGKGATALGDSVLEFGAQKTRRKPGFALPCLALPALRDSMSAGAAQRGVENISAVSRKSVPSTASEEITTVRVVA